MKGQNIYTDISPRRLVDGNEGHRGGNEVRAGAEAWAHGLGVQGRLWGSPPVRWSTWGHRSALLVTLWSWSCSERRGNRGSLHLSPSSSRERSPCKPARSTLGSRTPLPTHLPRASRPSPHPGLWKAGLVWGAGGPG